MNWKKGDRGRDNGEGLIIIICTYDIMIMLYYVATQLFQRKSEFNTALQMWKHNEEQKANSKNSV
jgi:hypothetical protein